MSDFEDDIDEDPFACDDNYDDDDEEDPFNEDTLVRFYYFS